MTETSKPSLGIPSSYPTTTSRQLGNPLLDAHSCRTNIRYDNLMKDDDDDDNNDNDNNDNNNDHEIPHFC